MSTLLHHKLTASALLLTMYAIPCPGSETENRLVNGDAELGDMFGWTPTDTIEVFPSLNAGEIGVEPGSIGKFSFSGGLGNTQEVASQIVDLSDVQTEIDVGGHAFVFSGLVQSRRLGGLIDTGIVELRFLDIDGVTTATFSFFDSQVVTGIYDWDAIEMSGVVPPLTRSVEVRMIAMRSGGSSTDCFFDNLCLLIDGADCPADFNGDGMLDFFDVSAFLDAFINSMASADLNEDGQLNFFDVSTFLVSYAAGCP